MKSIFALIIILFVSGDAIKIHDAWMRPGAEKMGTALYFTIDNTTSEPDTLYKVTSDISDKIQIHETYKEGELNGMREIKRLVIEPNSTIDFKPGSYHIMVMKLKKDILKGNKAEFTLYFSKAGKVKIEATAKVD
jgi:periplasmic copper chaperone A